MAALLQCFRRKRRENSNEKKPGKCKCTKMDKILQCKHCNSTLLGYWERDGTDGADGGACSKIMANSGCMDLQDSESRSSADGSSPTNPATPQIPNGNLNPGFFPNEYDYRPSTKGILGMSYMPVSKNDPNYNMNHRRRGKAVIFNFAQWNNTNIPSMDLQPRLGSEKDKRDLVDCLKKLSFEVVCYDNLKRQVYDGVIEQLRLEDHSDADCLVIAIMTHGEKNSIYLSDGSLIPVNSVWEEFEANACPTLAGKPKIFIIQACRGDRYDHGTRLMTGGGQAPNLQNDVTDSGTFSYVIPNAADIIVAFSCPLGHYSWRHPERGSWFIQSLCEVFNTSAYQMELQSLLTTVAREVAVNYESSTLHYNSDKKKQVPSTSSTLIRNVLFNEKPFVPYSVPLLVGNSSTVEIAQFINGQANGSQGISHHISLGQVQEAVANAQTSVAEILGGTDEITNPPELIPLVSVLDGVQFQNDDRDQHSEAMSDTPDNFGDAQKVESDKAETIS